METPDAYTPRGIEPAVWVEPAGLQSLPVERKPGEAVGLPLRRGHAQLPAEVDGSAEVAARLKPFEELATMLLKHLDGIANYCRTKVRFGVVEVINRGRGYKNLRYLLLKVKRLAVANVEFIAVHTVKKAA